jgi:predicted nicotinamide N-methyase
MILILWLSPCPSSTTGNATATLIAEKSNSNPRDDPNFGNDLQLFADEDTVNDNTGTTTSTTTMAVVHQSSSLLFGNRLPMSLLELELIIHSDLTLTMLQAPTAFDGVIGSDVTGGVLWGAGTCLSRWLTKAHVQHKKVLELGCGNGVPSMVASKYGARHVLSTDFEITTLQHMDRHIHINDCQSNMELRLLDWGETSSLVDESNNNYQADVILASDIIYGIGKLTALVNTIDTYLSPEGTLFLATRDGRLGVDEFRQLMTKRFVEVETIPCDPAHLDAQSLGRWVGSHSIHIFRRREGI